MQRVPVITPSTTGEPRPRTDCGPDLRTAQSCKGPTPFSYDKIHLQLRRTSFTVYSHCTNTPNCFLYLDSLKPRNWRHSSTNLGRLAEWFSSLRSIQSVSTMSRLTAHASRNYWLRTTLRAPAFAPPPRCTAAAAIRWASTEPPQNDGSSFKGQMMESIAARMIREKAERERAARERQQSSASRNWTVSFSTTTPVSCPQLSHFNSH